MADSAGSADIAIRTTGLRDFAGDSNVDLDVASVGAGSGTGSSQMDEGTAFFAANQQALATMTEHLTTMQLGQYGLRTGANQMADTFVSTENAVAAAQRSVTPYTSQGVQTI